MLTEKLAKKELKIKQEKKDKMMEINDRERKMIYAI